MRVMHFAVSSGALDGLGHVRRSGMLAAEAARRGFDVRFHVTDPERVRGFVPGDIELLAMPSTWKELAEADAVIVDGYTIPSTLGELAHSSGTLVVRIDDNAEEVWHADILINHNVHAEHVDYSRWPTACLLLGPEYALVDPALAALQQQTRPPRAVVSFGGTDDGRRSLPVCRALAERSVESACIIAPHHTLASARTSELAGSGIRIVQGADMVAEAATAGVYVGAAGVTAIEMSTAGLPLVLHATSENQAGAAAAFAERGARVVASGDPIAMADAAAAWLSTDASERPAPIADGRGASRVMHTIEGALTSTAPRGHSSALDH